MKKKKRNHRFFRAILFLFLLYTSVYGFLTLKTDNLVIKSGKEIVLALLLAYSLFKLSSAKILSKKGIVIVVFLIISIMIIGFLGNSVNRDWVTFVYGFKITILPMLGLFLGITMTKLNVNLDKVSMVVFILIIIGWIYQQTQGLNALVAAGWEYGVNVKSFNANTLRLPSFVGTPDGYAFLLCITGILLETSNMLKEKKIIQFVIKVTTLVFLVLATMRSALIFWFLFQLLMSWNLIASMKSKGKYLLLSIVCFSIPLGLLVFMQFVASSSLTSTSSLQDRLSHWGHFLSSPLTTEGLVGLGLGSVGSASRRTSQLGLSSMDYGVDNQLFAFYEQIGLLGTLVILMIAFHIIRTARRTYKTNNHAKIAVFFLICTFVSGMFTNVLEVYPFNLLLWIAVGMGIQKINQEDIMPEVGKLNKKKVRSGIVWP